MTGQRTQSKPFSPFQWRPDDHAHMSAIIKDDHTMRTPAYNQWLAARRARPDTTPDWPAWRDANQPRQRRAPSKRQPGGFAHHNGTIPGMGREAKLLAAKPAAPGTMSSAKPMLRQTGLMPIAGHNLQGGKATPPKATHRGVPRGKKAGA